MMYSIPAWGMREGKDPSKGRASWGGMCALCSVADCWGAELCYGSVQCRTSTWPLSDMKNRSLSSSDFFQLSWGSNKNGSVLLEDPPASELCCFSPDTSLPMSMLAFYIKPLRPLPSLQNIETRIMYSQAGLLCNVKTCFLGEAPIAHSQDELW